MTFELFICGQIGTAPSVLGNSSNERGHVIRPGDGIRSSVVQVLLLPAASAFLIPRPTLFHAVSRLPYAPLIAAVYAVVMEATTSTVRRRESRYLVRLSVNVTQDLAGEIEREAERDSVAVGVLVREAVTAGWARVQERRRKARRKRGGNGGGNGGGNE